MYAYYHVIVYLSIHFTCGALPLNTKVMENETGKKLGRSGNNPHYEMLHSHPYLPRMKNIYIRDIIVPSSITDHFYLTLLPY